MEEITFAWVTAHLGVIEIFLREKSQSAGQGPMGLALNVAATDTYKLRMLIATIGVAEISHGEADERRAGLPLLPTKH